MFYERTVTEEGITVITERMDTMRSVALGIWVAAGSRDERPGEGGISHFVEHMMFKGTPTRSASQISESFDRLGARFNAGTDKEYTTYYAQVIDQHWEEAFRLLADMLSNSLMEKAAVTSEREVVLEEIARAEDAPDEKVHELFAEALWPEHPLGRPILGLREVVGNFTPEDVFAYTGRRYETGDVVVAAAGNLEHDAIAKLVGETLTRPRGPRADRGIASPTAQNRFEALKKDTEQAHIAWGTLGLQSRDPDRFAMGALDQILGGGMSSRLFQEIREKRGLAYAVGSYHAQYLDTGQYTVYAGTRPENAEQVVKLIRQEADKILADGPTDDEVYRAKEAMKGQVVLSMESTNGRMARLGKSEVTHGEILSLDELIEHIDAVGRNDILRVAEQTLGSPRVLAVVSPFSREELEHLQE